MGGVDIARDNATVKSLIGDFKGGIEQNGKNLQAVSIYSFRDLWEGTDCFE